MATLIQELIDAFRCLPGVGNKSAQRMVLHLLERDRKGGERLARILSESLARVSNCQLCRTLTENSLCSICANHLRDDTEICVVESPADVIAIEQTATFKGKYFVLLGKLSPLDGIGPEEIGLEKLIARLQEEPIKELIIATNSTVEGQATAHYIAELAKEFNVKISRIAHGVPLGGELEYVDGLTLAQALVKRIVMV